MHHNYFRIIILALILLTLSASGSLVMAQDDGGDDTTIDVEFEFEGIITGISDDGILVEVDGWIFTLAPAGAFNPSTLEVGDSVRFDGTMLNDDTIQVSELEVVEPEDVPDDGGDGDDGGDVDDGDDGDDDGDDGGDVDDGDDDDVTACGRDDHPVVEALAAAFEQDYDTVMGYVCEGFGMGEVARALLIAEQSEDYTVDDLLDMAADGLGWGEIVKEVGVDPSSLAPGQAISVNKNKNKNQNEEQEQEQEQEQNTIDAAGQTDDDSVAPGNSGRRDGNNGDAPGNSGNAPGQNKDDDGAPGNSGNAPGQNKDDNGAPGNSGNAPGHNKDK
ncbi:MAG: hypothetical protein JW966_12780 [Anaerolineae bacterium]|nr:hypothetical protein [Anaerolineae bacterium]